MAPRHPASAPTVLKFSVVTVGRHAGDAEVRIDGDHRAGHFTFNDRGRGPDITTTMVLDGSGFPREFHATGHDYLKAPVDETLAAKDGHLAWTTTSDRGEATHTGFYVPLAGSVDLDGLLARALTLAKDHRIALLPGGEAWIEDDGKFDVRGHALRRVAIAGLGQSPSLVWLDDHDELFAEVSPWSSAIRAGSEDLIGDLVKLDAAWNEARAKRLAGKLARTPASLAFVHARVFDSEHAAVIPDTTVVITGDRISAVGANVPPPAGAEVIDATGKTLLPGLWDMHVHLGDGDGALILAAGITTARDMGNDIDSLASRVAHFDDGSEVGPRVLRAGLIDGPGELAAPTGVLAGTADEAKAAVAKYADHGGYVQIKIYSSVKPELVPVIAKEAHAPGMRVSGHIPTGMNAAEAVEAGYDEIQHVNFLFLRFLATAADDTRTPLRFTRVAEKGADLDLDGKDVQGFLDLLVAHKTVLDPTLATFDGMFTTGPGELDPILAPWAGRLPATIERGGHNGGLPTTDRAKFRASYKALLAFVKRAWDRHIRIVAGTDAIAGISLAHELELYVRAGIPAPDVLALATIGAARDGRRHGARLDRRRQAGRCRAGRRRPDDGHRGGRTVVVVCRGRVYDPNALFASVGMRGITAPTSR